MNKASVASIEEIEELSDGDFFYLTLELAFIGIAVKNIQECLQNGNLAGIVIWNEYIAKKLKQILSFEPTK